MGTICRSPASGRSPGVVSQALAGRGADEGQVDTMRNGLLIKRAAER